MDIRSEISKLLVEKKLTLSTCESVTGGMISDSIVDIEGCSSFFKGSIVCYSNESKIKILDIQEKVINENGSISEIVCEKMAANCNKIFKTDICIAVTGNAGPKAIEGKEIGLCYLSICLIDKVYTYKYKSSFSKRNEIRSDLTILALKKLKDFISK